MGWNPAYRSQLSWSLTASSLFWMSSSNEAQMAPSRQLYTGKPPTQTATSTLCPTTHGPTNLRWSRHCTAQGRSNLLGRDRKKKETRHIRQALINIGYLRGVLQHHITPAHTRPAEDHSRGPVITLPYVHGLSEAVWRVLTPLGLRVSFRPNTTLKLLLVRPKDWTPTEELAGVVYQVPCANCPASYVGQTGRCLGKRIKEHQKAVESGDCANSALAEHACMEPPPHCELG